MISSILTALTVLVLSFWWNEVDAKVYCADPTKQLERLEELTPSDKLGEILNRIRPGEEWELEPLLGENDNRLPHQRLQMDNTPNIPEMNQELKKIIEEIKLDIKWEQDVCSLEDFRQLMIECNYNQPNAAKFMHKIIDEKDQEKFDCLSSKKSIVKEKKEKREKKQKDKENNKKFLKEYDCELIQDEFVKALCKDYK